MKIRLVEINMSEMKIGKLYKMKYLELADIFFKHEGPDNFGQIIYSALTTVERLLLAHVAHEVLLLLKEEPRSLPRDGSAITWVFLVGKQIYHTVAIPIGKKNFYENLFLDAEDNKDYIPTWQNIEFSLSTK